MGVEEKVGAWILAARKKGLDDEDIEKEMLRKGYSKRFIIRKLEEFPPRSIWAKYLLPLAISLIVLGIAFEIYVNLSLFYIQSCKTDECFSKLADQCKSVKMEKAIAGSVYSFEERGCILTKTARKMNDTEPASIKDLLESKSMTCRYPQGNFDGNLIKTVSLGMGNCEGALKDNIEIMITEF